MKNETMKANNLILGAIYINALSGQPCRLVNIVSCEGAWLESFDGSGYGVTVPFDAVHYASQDEVDDYLEDLHVYQAGAAHSLNRKLNIFSVTSVGSFVLLILVVLASWSREQWSYWISERASFSRGGPVDSSGLHSLVDAFSPNLTAYVPL